MNIKGTRAILSVPSYKSAKKFRVYQSVNHKNLIIFKYIPKYKNAIGKFIL